jgi:beta-alanine degradation protein BauB
MIVEDNAHVRVLLPPIGADELDAPAPANGVVTIGIDTGEARYAADGNAERPGSREVRVELREPPVTEPHELDATTVDPDRYRIVLDNDVVRVVRLGFAAGEEGVMVHHPPRVIVTLTDVQVRMAFEDGSTDERAVDRGLAAWLEAQTLQTANAGSAPLEVVLVEPKAPHEEER